MKAQTRTLLHKNRREVIYTSFLFLFPALALLLIFYLYPIFESFKTSGYVWNGISPDKTWVGLMHWKKLIYDDVFWKACSHNILMMIMVTLTQIPIGLALATFIEFGGRKTKTFKIIWFLPMLMSSVAIGFLFRYGLATHDGIISSISNLLGGPNIDLLGNTKTALPTVVGVATWQFMPFYMIYFLAGYTNISIEIYEASIIDGATRGQYFRKIALPLMLPLLRNAAIMIMVGALKYFDLVYVLTSGGPNQSTELLATYMYKESFYHFKMGYGSAIACGMFILITLFSLFTLRLTAKKED